MGVWVLDGVDIGEKNIIHLLLGQIHHVSIYQFYRVTSLSLCILLGKLHRLFVAGMGQHYIVAQVPEKLICQGKELKHNQDKGNPDGLLIRINSGIISSDGKLSCHLI